MLQQRKLRSRAAVDRYQTQHLQSILLIDYIFLIVKPFNSTL